MARGREAVPLTGFQRVLLAELAKSPTADRYLAGGAAMHFAPQSTRYSDDLDFFHDSEARVASAFRADRERLHDTKKRGSMSPLLAFTSSIRLSTPYHWKYR